jgi:hypothetical protein
VTDIASATVIAMQLLVTIPERRLRYILYFFLARIIEDEPQLVGATPQTI